jgi:hypothetical protein
MVGLGRPALRVVRHTLTSAALLSVIAAAASDAQKPGIAPMSAESLRRNASVYAPPEYPAPSVAANRAGRVTVDVVVGTNTPTSPLARVQSTHVISAPDTLIASAVLRALEAARYMPVFDDSGRALKVSSQVVWDFHVVQGKGTVVDPNAPPASQEQGVAAIAALDLRIVDRARELLSAPDKWNRTDTRQCPPKATRVSLYCALELATLEIAGAFDHRGTVMDDARDALADVTPNHPDYGHWLMGYNNDSTTTFIDIARVLEATRVRIAKRIPPTH